MQDDANFNMSRLDILGRKEKHLQRRGHNGALGDGWVQFCHGITDGGWMHNHRKAQIDQSLVVRPRT